jgi:hypothetical protein
MAGASNVSAGGCSSFLSGSIQGFGLIHCKKASSSGKKRILPPLVEKEGRAINEVWLYLLATTTTFFGLLSWMYLVHSTPVGGICPYTSEIWRKALLNVREHHNEGNILWERATFEAITRLGNDISENWKKQT